MLIAKLRFSPPSAKTQAASENCVNSQMAIVFVWENDGT
jgi:hypothetical protein